MVNQIATQSQNSRQSSPIWHTLETARVFEVLGLDSAEKGLSRVEAARRLQEYGPNELVERGAKSPWKIVWEQLTAVMVLILLAAAVLSLFLGKYLEAGAILAIVGLFTLLGFVQEYRAERAIAALKKLAVPVVRVYRDGVLQELSASELVPGDLVLLEAGNLVPADGRVIESVNLRLQEAALTGESEPVEKTIEALPDPGLQPGERRNLVYMGTLVTYGRGTVLVIETGMRTQLGKIASLIQSVKHEMTPLQDRLDRVGKQLAVAGILVALLIIAIGLFSGEELSQMILTGVSLAVAVIPEGLPAVVTITLALGAQRMLKRNALIRKLPAVETLGSVTTICSDKTGTLTENRMSVVVLEVAGHRLDLTSEELPSLREEVSGEDEFSKPAELPATISVLTLLLAGGALCNDAQIQPDEEPGQYRTVGDPTEAALLLAAIKNGLEPDTLRTVMPRLGELPFDAERKRMTTIHRRPVGGLSKEVLAVWGQTGLSPELPYLALTKGAVDGLLELSSYIWDRGLLRPLNPEQRLRVQDANNRLADNGMRVLGLAFRPVWSVDVTVLDESDLIFVGLVAMIDPPRSEAKQAVQTCITAGIRPIMITGDHPLTARYIARELGIAHEEDALVVTGAELDAMDATRLEEIVGRTSVFARVVPEHKLRIVEALQKKGQVVAMTGDGVNDAPALKKSDIGVAMGITGTDVSKEASDMILTDDNFTTIVSAVEEGRVIYDNLRRFVLFSVAGNVGKVAIMLLWPLPFLLFGLPLEVSVALLPLQLLWLNLMTDGLLGLSMGFEGAEKNVMRRPPRTTKEGIFSGGMGWHVAGIGLVIGLTGLGIGFVYYREGLVYWQSMIFTAAAFLQIFQALATRSNYDSLFSIGVFSNRTMWLIIGVVLVLQLLALYSPLSLFLGLKPLPPFDLLVCGVLGAMLLIVVELEKLGLRKFHQLRATRLN